MKIAGPDHPIRIEAQPGRVVVCFAGAVVADTSAALSLREAAYPAVLYVPRADAMMDCFKRSERHTHCPYKGDASYFDLEAGGQRAANAVWSYETPYPAMAAIKDHLAFYPGPVVIEHIT